MAEKNTSYYNKKEIFENECRPLLQELSSKCHLYNLPFFFSCCVMNDQSDSEYVNEVSGAAGRGITLTKDLIGDYMAVILGFKVVKEDELILEVPSAPDDLELEDEIMFPTIGINDE